MHTFIVQNVSLNFAEHVDRIRENIRNLKSKLNDLLETDAGLLNGLLHVNVLTRKQFDDVISQKIQSRKNDRLLDYVLYSYTGDFSELMNVLGETGQKHVINLITSGGGI